MISFVSGDGTPLTDQVIYDTWRSCGEDIELPQWLWEQMCAGQLILKNGNHEITYEWYIKHCREQENQHIRDSIRNQQHRSFQRSGLSAKEARAKMQEFIYSEEYKTLLSKKREQSRTLQRLQNAEDSGLQEKYHLYCMRLLKEFYPAGVGERELVDSLDMKEGFKAAFQMTVRHVTEKLKRHLQSQRQYLSVRSGATSRRRELTPALLPQFLTCYLSRWNVYKLSDAMDGMALETHLKGKSLRRFLIRSNHSLSSRWNDSDQSGRERLLGAVADRFLRDYPVEMLLEAVAKEFTRESILDLLLCNPLYREMVLDFRENRDHYARLERQILDQMPKSFLDLYPLARQQRRRFFLHLGPTNSGKTHQALQAFRAADSGVYLAPLRLLAYEVFERTNLAGVLCDMCTGEEEILVPEAKHLSCTIEMLRQEQHYAVAVIDEAQMLIDEERGAHWTTAILGVWADEVHVCAAENTREILIQLIESCGDDYTVLEHQRQVPLVVEEEPFCFPESVQPEDALIVFSKNSVQKRASELQAQGIRTSVIYGALPYDVRQEEVRKFVNHETEVIVATDAVGMGLNLPIRRVVFLEAQKFDGVGHRSLSGMEVKQIAGRAGRRGIYEVGYYTSAQDCERIQKKFEKNEKPIRHVYIDFPQSLLLLDGKLSYLMEQWNAIPDDELYHKGKITVQLELCILLEKESEDKELIYRFITIPFAENNRPVKQLWLELFRLQQDGRPVEQLLEQFLPDRMDEMTLEELELCYQYGDLFFHYCRRFSPDLCKRVAVKKANISNAIKKLLG